MIHSTAQSRLKIILPALLALPILPLARITAAENANPNVLFILADDLGCMDIGAFNPKTFYETPTIDGLAKRGMKFTQAYAACCVCSPTRGSIMTGNYPPRFGITDFIPGMRSGKVKSAPNADHLPLEEVTIAESLRDAGYATFFAGKWHLGGGEFYPGAQGFPKDLTNGQGAKGNVQFWYPESGLPVPDHKDDPKIMSDNGGLSTAEGSPTSNLPLRAGKGWPYEGGVREPMIVVAPGVTKPGTVCDVPVISTDFYPTLLQLTGQPLKPGQHLDGVSFLPLLKGESAARGKPLFWHYPHYGNQGGAPNGVIRDGDWKLIEWYEDGALELYNISQDIGEQNNLAAQQPGKTKALHEKLIAWRKEVGALMPTPNPN